jgi:hypothetical protein
VSSIAGERRASATHELYHYNKFARWTPVPGRRPLPTSQNGSLAKAACSCTKQLWTRTRPALPTITTLSCCCCCYCFGFLLLLLLLLLLFFLLSSAICCCCCCCSCCCYCVGFLLLLLLLLLLCSAFFCCCCNCCGCCCFFFFCCRCCFLLLLLSSAAAAALFVDVQVKDGVTLQYFSAGGAKLLSRHPCNSRDQCQVLEAYVGKVLAHGCVPGVRGNAWCVEDPSATVCFSVGCNIGRMCVM